MDTKEEDSDVSSLDTKEKSWSSDVELVLNDILNNTKQLSLIHKNNFLVLRHYLFMIRLPIIVLSSINSVLSVGMSSFVSQSITSTSNCIISLICGILGSLELFIGIQSKSDKEFETFQALKSLSIKISHTLKLEASHRETTGLMFLKEVVSEYSTIFENSLVNNMEIDDTLLQLEMKMKKDAKNTVKNKLLMFAQSPRDSQRESHQEVEERV
jgi:hypothetical protein